MDTDVIIAGAGPTGLMLANQLARRGVRVMIVDRHSGPAQQSRAMAVQARTLEIYARLGIAPQALALGKRGSGANMWAEGRWMARIPLGDIGRDLSPFPYVLMLGQDDNERIMGAHLATLGVEVQWNTELVSFEQNADRVTALLRQHDGTTRSVTAAYIAGCDGAHSAVREQAGIGFPGAPYEQTFFVADTTATGPMHADEVNIYLWRDGFHLLFPMRGTDHWRIVGILPPALRQRDKLTFDEVIPAIRQEAGAALHFAACSWFSTYRIHHRRAERFRDRRAFLLGDAAHIHSPAGGQGMNTGLQDAYNLAWKLALVVKGRAAAMLLDTYEQERIPVAERLLQTTDRAFTLVVSENWIAGLFRTRILSRVAAFVMRFKRVQTLAFMTISQTGISYRGSALSAPAAALPADAPQPGDRFPWMQLRAQAGGAAEDLFASYDDTRYTLLLFGQAMLETDWAGYGDLLRVLAIPDDAGNAEEMARVGVPQTAFYLLRPDGHVGLAGLRSDAPTITRYLSGCGLRPAEARA